MIDKLQQLKGKTKLKVKQFLSNYYDEMNQTRQSTTFKFEVHQFANNAQGIAKILHEVSLWTQF